MKSEKINPYVLSQDVNYLLRNWSEETGYKVPDIKPYQNELAQKLESIFEVLDVIGEDQLQDSARNTLTRSKYNGGVCVSLDRAYMPAVDQNNEVLYIDSSRQIDSNFNSIGLGTRTTDNRNLTEQMTELAEIVGDRPVTIYDDVAFGGDTMLEVLDLAKNVGINVVSVELSISTSEALDKLTQAGYSSSTDFEYETILDEICERDFFIGAPYSGRTILEGSKAKGAPYVLPLGLPVEWASIPEADALEFSQFCLSLSLRFWAESEYLSGAQIPTWALAKPPVLLEENKSVTEAIRKLIIE